MHAEGRTMKAILDEARIDVARLAGVPPRDVVFTSGGSEAIASGIRGAVDRSGPKRWRVVVSAIEHSAVLDAARALAELGHDVFEVPCESSGRVDVDTFLSALNDRTALACLQAANNETGVVQPVSELGAACRAAGIPFLVDAVQAAGKIAIDRDRWCADLVAISAHKIGGPQGAGALIVREGMSMAPLIAGGAQERRRRGGTEAVAAIAGFGAAARIAHDELRAEAARLLSLRERLESAIEAMAPDVRIHGVEAPRLPNTFPNRTATARVFENSGLRTRSSPTRFVQPMTLVGRTALSLEMQTTFSQRAESATSRTFLVPMTLLRTASSGNSSMSGTCLSAPAWNTTWGLYVSNTRASLDLLITSPIACTRRVRPATGVRS